MHSTPALLKAYDKAYQEKIKRMDVLAWQFCGNYVMPAVSVAVEHCLHGKKAKSKYIEKPIFINTKEKSNTGQEEIAVYEMKQRIKMLKKQGLPESPI